jgi:hypothetical protein
MARTRNREDVEAMFSLLKGYFMMVGDTGIESGSRHVEDTASCQAICRLTWTFAAQDHLSPPGES